MTGSTQLALLCLVCILLVACQSVLAFTPGKLNGESESAMKNRMMTEALRLKSSAKRAAMEHGKKHASGPRPGSPLGHAIPKVPGTLGASQPRRSVPRVQRVRPMVDPLLPGKLRLQRLNELPLKRISKQNLDKCNNGVHDLNFETDVDCGGICVYALKMINNHQQTRVCEHGQTCKKGEDCKSGQCAEGQCLARRALEARPDEVMTADTVNAFVAIATAQGVESLGPKDVFPVVLNTLDPDHQGMSDEHLAKIKERVNAMKKKEGLNDENLGLKVNKNFISRGKPFAFIKKLRAELDH